MARLGAQKLGQKSGDPRWLSLLLVVPPWASVSPQEAQRPHHLGWLFTITSSISTQLSVWAHVAPRGPTVL